MNFTNCTVGPSVADKTKTVTEKMVISVTLSVITILTTLLNSAVIAAICITRKLHLPANYLICSLAVTDLLVAILVMPLSIAYIAMDTWALGYVICEIWLSVDMTCCTCSILHLCVIALDRYWAITDAIEYAQKRTAKRAGFMILIVWGISIFISMPPLFWRRHHINSIPSQCIIQHDHVVYTIYSTFGAFYIPLTLILILYYRIYHAAKNLYQKRGSSRHLSNRSNDSQNSFAHCKLTQTFCVSDFSTSDPMMEFDKKHASVRMPPYDNDLDPAGDRQQQISSSRERKAARILGLILGAFILSWLPFFIKELVVGLSPYTVSAEVADFLTWLGYVNSLINPLLYTSFNDDFKLAFKKLIRCKEHS
uniref:5-hydroxytryptamine receptor 1E n=1 Tax=Geotrypetes seraphini TaxID=260995 RepID=A0A6P8Q7Y0_GEOSA|nr:5-hydroxytryptamine receptor 1E [Geotrypetes seraphini]XP_033791551.1 5-hydroxytryptamine receptor 1E [Geotrypetes seraphini]XP_033791552.1 5-hydroxytryptamine receptor 1E [Geotrypetes seraphini]XP_033791553.1 5-hydroxytryptamine receptor 1E [Geotrypetes seraphini]XP_033791554.1 5-hydroxytryptamine receptor 1E [Geotrypetes seraphini]XP_033791555.1 5-hydroxytryptamine receptor 1E [Geotrypetes seraphini]XP_033791556.1 5-hydroxytryptamine receptor 1E [Geotrypetes seraphini]XP_033791557.1 5-h